MTTVASVSDELLLASSKDQDLITADALSYSDVFLGLFMRRNDFAYLPELANNPLSDRILQSLRTGIPLANPIVL